MLASTGIAIFIIPSLFVMIEKLAHRGKKSAEAPATPGTHPEPGPAPAGGAGGH